MSAVVTQADALALSRRGLCVIPVPAPRPGVPAGRPGDGKVPAIAWREFQGRRSTEDEVARWFENGEPLNIAIVCGAVSGVVVIDADSPDASMFAAMRLPYTPWQVTTARGFHLYYRHPGRPVPNRAKLETPAGRLALDVRGDGGYVIGPGSVHASGAIYEYAGNWSASRDELPVFWPGWLERGRRAESAPPTAATRPRSRDDVVERARRYLQAIPRPEIGHGSDAATLYAACRLVRGFGLTDDDAADLLWAWAGNRPGWTRGWVERKVRNARLYGDEPIGALR